MNLVRFNFTESTVYINRNGQVGTEYVPDLQEKRGAILEALGQPDQNIPVLELDFETGRMVPDLGRTDLQSRFGAVYSAAGYEMTDLSNAVGIVEALMEGKIPRGLFEKLMEMEAGSNAANADISLFLDMLNPPKSE